MFHNKDIDCIRVDGATDEGPSHELVQYWWTEWHFRMEKVATLVTSRSSGSSYISSKMVVSHWVTPIRSFRQHWEVHVLINLLGKLMKPSYVRILIWPSMFK